LIILDSLFQAAISDAAHFDRIMATEGEIFRSVAGRKTLRFTHEGRQYFIKIHTGVGWIEIFKNLLTLRLPVLGAQNEWLAIQRLNELGVKTLRLAGYGLRGWNPAQLQSFIITDDLGDIISLEDLCRNWRQIPPPPLLKRMLIGKVAAIAKRLHENGVNHRDFYLCHFVLETSQPAASASLYLIDLHRVQLRHKTPGRWTVKDLAGLYFSAMDVGLSRRDLLRFVKIYHGQSLRQIYPGKLSFWKMVENKALRLYQKPKKP
jgi:heptose I phosphotransferase